MKTFKGFLFENDYRKVMEFNTINELTEFINKNCNQWLFEIFGKKQITSKFLQSIIVSENDVLFRGIRTIQRYFLETAKEDRRPLNTPLIIHDNINKALQALGFSIHRGNSLFCSNKESQAYDYGDVFVCFPLNGYEYLFSEEITDFFVQYLVNLKIILKNNIFPNLTKYLVNISPNSEELFQSNYNEFEKQYLIPLFGREVMYQFTKNEIENFRSITTLSEEEFEKLFEIPPSHLQQKFNFQNKNIKNILKKKYKSIEIMVRKQILCINKYN